MPLVGDFGCLELVLHGEELLGSKLYIEWRRLGETFIIERQNFHFKIKSNIQSQHWAWFKPGFTGALHNKYWDALKSNVETGKT